MSTTQTAASVTSVRNIPLRDSGSRNNPNMREVVLSNGTTIFASYREAVAAHVPGKGYQRTTTKWSVTTSKHINAWLARRGADDVAEVDQADIDALMPESFCL